MLTRSLVQGHVARSFCCALTQQQHLSGVSQRQARLARALYIVGTPIGNLEDITLRAIRILRDASVIMAEDTRHTRKLLTHLHIGNNLISLHSHNEFSRAKEVLSRLGQGEAIALVCDAGMPTVSDAGVDVVAATASAGYSVVPVPGPSASLAALAAAGLPTNEFHFVGFLPPKKAARQKQLQMLTEVVATLIFFVPARSIATILEDMAACIGRQRKAAVCRELTKVHEEILRGSLEELSQLCTERELQGEITLIVQGSPGANDPAVADARRAEHQRFVEDLLECKVSVTDAARLAATHLGASKKEMYDWANRSKLAKRGSFEPKDRLRNEAPSVHLEGTEGMLQDYE